MKVAIFVSPLLARFIARGIVYAARNKITSGGVHFYSNPQHAMACWEVEEIEDVPEKLENMDMFSNLGNFFLSPSGDGYTFKVEGNYQTLGIKWIILKAVQESIRRHKLLPVIR